LTVFNNAIKSKYDWLLRGGSALGSFSPIANSRQVPLANCYSPVWYNLNDCTQSTIQPGNLVSRYKLIVSNIDWISKPSA